MVVRVHLVPFEERLALMPQFYGPDWGDAVGAKLKGTATALRASHCLAARAVDQALQELSFGNQRREVDERDWYGCDEIEGEPA